MPPRRFQIRVVRRRRLNAVRRPARRGIVVKKLVGSNVHSFKRTVFNSGAVSGSTLNDVYGALSFNLSSVPNYTEFTALFDQYRIDAVKVTFMPRANSAELGTNQGITKLFTVVDYDDAATPTAINELMQYENLKTTRSTDDHNRTLRPMLARAVYQAGLTAYGTGRGWVDCANPSVPHYGLRYALQQLPAGNQSYDLKIKYYLSFKNVV